MLFNLQTLRNQILALTFRNFCFVFWCGPILHWISPCMSHSVTEVLGLVYTISTNVSGQHVHSRLEWVDMQSRSLSGALRE